MGVTYGQVPGDLGFRMWGSGFGVWGFDASAPDIRYRSSLWASSLVTPFLAVVPSLEFGEQRLSVDTLCSQ